MNESDACGEDMTVVLYISSVQQKQGVRQVYARHT